MTDTPMTRKTDISKKKIIDGLNIEQIFAEELAFLLGKVSGMVPPTGSEAGDYLKHMPEELIPHIQNAAKRSAIRMVDASNSIN